MYVERLQLTNYGPVEKLDIEFPYDGSIPKPVVFVGENGSGKSIVLAHIVNGLILAKGIAFPETPEVETGRVYKLRDSAYITSGYDHYFTRVDYANALYYSELRLLEDKVSNSRIPDAISGTPAQRMWEAIRPNSNDGYDTNILHDSMKETIERTFSENCVLYFPFDRSEEPAWLNKRNLTAQPQHLQLEHLSRGTDRRVISLSPLQDNQEWLFNVIYDAKFHADNGVILHHAAISIVEHILNNPSVLFGIGSRLNRVLSLEAEDVTIAPNIFHLSSGQTSLLNLFLSILRDFDLTRSTFAETGDFQGIVVVDEIDLHLHTVHQYQVLPRLIRSFPKVQFIITTHSPLFVLGMNEVFGEDGFGLYRLPHGQQISPEEFSEFSDAYQAFTETVRFSNDVRTAFVEAQKPIVFVEGTTDQRYIDRASKLLGRETVLGNLELRDGGGKGNLTKIWRDSLLPLTEMLPQQALLLFDCDTNKPSASRGKLLQRSIPLQDQHPIMEGIENLFSKSTLEMARQYNPAFFRTEDEHGGTDKDGQPITIPERWFVNDKEKTNLCDWLCENGTLEDFQRFNVVFDILEEVFDPT